jgi:hypothetical protein
MLVSCQGSENTYPEMIFALQNLSGRLVHARAQRAGTLPVERGPRASRSAVAIVGVRFIVAVLTTIFAFALVALIDLAGRQSGSQMNTVLHFGRSSFSESFELPGKPNVRST